MRRKGGALALFAMVAPSRPRFGDSLFGHPPNLAADVRIEVGQGRALTIVSRGRNQEILGLRV